MIKHYTLCRGFDLGRDANTVDVSQIIYSQEKNTLISVINKNCSYSLEHWISNSANTTFKVYNWHTLSSVIDENNLPTMITILRDPIARVKSAIDMLCEQYTAHGLHITFENFINLEFVVDPHLVPQCVFVPVECTDNKLSRADLNLSWNDIRYKYPNGWQDHLKNYDVLSWLTEKNKFFYMKPGHSVTEELGKYLDVFELGQWWSNVANHNVQSRQFPAHYVTYLETIYSEDYRLINSVKFENV